MGTCQIPDKKASPEGEAYWFEGEVVVKISIPVVRLKVVIRLLALFQVSADPKLQHVASSTLSAWAAIIWASFLSPISSRYSRNMVWFCFQARVQRSSSAWLSNERTLVVATR